MNNLSSRAAGNPTTRTLPDGITVTDGYDTLNRLTSVKETANSGSNTLASYTYTLGPAGNRTKVTEADGTTVSWSYDADYHLTGETLTASNGTVQAQASYAYDAVGNRTSMSSGGTTTTYAYNSLDQLTSASTPSQSSTYTYDGRGNLTSATTSGSGASSTTSYRWNAANDLADVILPNGTSSSYAYDAEGRQVSQTIAAATTNDLWDEQSPYGDVVLETDGISGAVQASYMLGETNLLAQTRNGTVSYVLPDGQNSVRGLANASGTITDTYRFDAFGNLQSHTGSTPLTYGYTGQRYNAQTDLYQLRTRSYDPATSRFLSADVADGDINHPIDLNRYLYAESNPVNGSDPTGETFEEYIELTKLVAQNTQQGANLIGEADELLIGRLEAHLEAIFARALVKEALDSYLKEANLKEFPGPKGEFGLGLGEYTQNDGVRVKIAAFNDVGLANRDPALEEAYKSAYKELEKVVTREGYTVIHESTISLDKSPGAVGLEGGHEERYLVDYIKANQSVIPDKSIPIVGVSQNTICGTCAQAFGYADGKYGDLEVPLTDDSTIVVAGNFLPSDLALDPVP